MAVEEEDPAEGEGAENAEDGGAEGQSAEDLGADGQSSP